MATHNEHNFSYHLLVHVKKQEVYMYTITDLQPTLMWSILLPICFSEGFNILLYNNTTLNNTIIIRVVFISSDIFNINPIRSGLFQTVNDPGGGGSFKSPPPPLRSRKLFCQSSPYHTCKFYQVFLA